jgi:hypothetical protein
MTTISLENIREELCQVMRSGDILTISVRGVTTATQTATGAPAQTTLTLLNLPVRNIRIFTKDAVTQRFLTDYTINYTTGVITFSALTGGEALSVTYDYGNGDKIYPDMPRDDLTLESFPRVGIELTSSSTTPLGLGGMTHISDLMITIMAWVPANKVSGIGGTKYLSDLMSSIRNVIRQNAKLFSTFSYITPTATSPIIRSTNNKIIQQSEDFSIKFLVEAN